MEEKDPIAEYYDIPTEASKRPIQVRRTTLKGRLNQLFRLLDYPLSVKAFSALLIILVFIFVLVPYGRLLELFSALYYFSDFFKAIMLTITSPVGAAGVSILFIFFLVVRFTRPNWKNFASDMATELLSITITVLIIGMLVEWQGLSHQKSQLIRDFGGYSNEFAVRAARELRHYSWLSDGSLNGSYLVGANLTGAFLEGADLSMTDLLYAKLMMADLSGANLSRANLFEADLTGADLRGADLTYANIRGAILKDAKLEKADLRGAIYDDATIFSMAGPLLRKIGPGVDLWGANLSNAFLSGADLSSAELSYANLSGANLSAADLSGANLQGANLTDAWLLGTHFYEANLTGAALRGVNFTTSKLGGVDLTEAQYDNATTWPIGFDPKAAGANNVCNNGEWFRIGCGGE